MVRAHPTVPAQQRRYFFARLALLRAATGARLALRGAVAVLTPSLRARRRSALIRVCQPSLSACRITAAGRDGSACRHDARHRGERNQNSGGPRCSPCAAALVCATV